MTLQDTRTPQQQLADFYGNVNPFRNEGFGDGRTNAGEVGVVVPVDEVGEVLTKMKNFGMTW